MRSSVMARCWASRAFSTASREESCASSASCSRSARSLVSSERWTARRNSTSRSCSSRAYSVSRSISKTFFCASRFWLRISTSVRCSISLRILRRVSIDSVELGQAFGVEGVRRIEIFEAGLVEVDDGDVLQLQAVGGERLGGEVADLVGVVAALLVHFLERHLCRHHAHRRGEFAFEQAADAVLLQRAPAERLRGGGDRRRATRRRARRIRR